MELQELKEPRQAGDASYGLRSQLILSQGDTQRATHRALKLRK